MIFQLDRSDVLATSMRAKSTMGADEGRREIAPGMDVNASLIRGVRGQEGEGSRSSTGEMEARSFRERNAGHIYIFDSKGPHGVVNHMDTIRLP